MSIRWTFLLFALSLPFEQILLPILSGDLSVSRIAGVLVLARCFLHPRVALSRPAPAFLCFGAYLLILYYRGAIASGEFTGFLFYYLTMVQLVFFAWVISKPLRVDRKLAEQSLYAFALACSTLVIGMLLELPGFVRTGQSRGIDRVSAGGSDPNMLGTMLAVSIVIVIGFFLGSGLLKWRSKVLLGCLGLLLPMGLMMTQSRTAVFSLILGLAAYFLPVGGFRFRKVVLVIGALVAMVFLITRNVDFLVRLSSVFDDDMSGRGEILARSFVMIAERPFFGWGPGFIEYLGAGAHNIFTELLLQVGLFGAIPFLLGLLFVVRESWKSRTTDLGRICFAALVTFLLSNLTLVWINFKLMWFLVALALAARSGNNELRGLGRRMAVEPNRLLRYRR
jgi:O-antigen ligase